MADAERDGVGRIALAILVLCALAGLGWAILRAQRPPPGAVEPVWDRTACTQCRMLVSDPRFAAQLHTPGGVVLHFDDPGCLMSYVSDRSPDVHASYFHHLREDRWLAAEEVAFVPGGSTPMAYGFGAVGRREGQGVDLDEARRRVAEREERGTGE